MNGDSSSGPIAFIGVGTMPGEGVMKMHMPLFHGTQLRLHRTAPKEIFFRQLAEITSLIEPPVLDTAHASIDASPCWIWICRPMLTSS